MSQVKFRGQVNDGREVMVMAGWHHPLEKFFLVVYDLTADPEGEKVLWSTLDDFVPTDTTKGVRAKLTELGPEVPEGFWERVELREGNIIHLYTEVGWRTF